MHIRKRMIFFCFLAADIDGVNEKDDLLTQMMVDTMPTSMPGVVVKTEPVDNDCPPEPLESNVKIKDISLISNC